MDYSYSRISSFRICPRKFKYRYVERIKEPDTPELLGGRLFHTVIEEYYKGDDFNATIKEYENLVSTGKLATPKDLFKNVLSAYTEQYQDIDDAETIIGVEMSFGEQWEDGENFTGIADRIVERGGLHILRDTKTTFGKLKYTHETVQYNPQLLTYAALVEEHLGIKIDAIEIDEVRLAMLEEVPINKNGKPTADFKRLSNVTYEKYYETLAGMGLSEDPAYQGVLDKLEKRGHPLFRRTMAQLVDDSIMQDNIQDMYATYKIAKECIKMEYFPRHKGRLCDWCGYKGLCNLDYVNPHPEDRSVMIRQISKE